MKKAEESIADVMKKTLSGEYNLPTGLEDEFPPQFDYDDNAAKNLDAHNSIHLGQRKLFNALLHFCTTEAREGDTVVYAGAAPGNNILFVAELFPFLHWELFDPNFANDASMAQKFAKQNKITVMPSSLGVESVQSIHGRTDANNILFFSDIRSTHKKFVQEDLVWMDMDLQMKLVQDIKPRAYCLKFRIPYCRFNKKVNSFDYLRGTLWLQPFNRTMSTEARLVGKGGVNMEPNIRYDLTHEKRHYYINMIMREFAYYPGSVVRNVDGANHDFDNALETVYCQEYLAKYPKTSKKFNDTSGMRQWLNSLQGLKPRAAHFYSPRDNQTFSTSGQLPFVNPRLTDTRHFPERDARRIPKLLKGYDAVEVLTEIIHRWGRVSLSRDEIAKIVRSYRADLKTCITHSSIDNNDNYELAELEGDATLSTLVIRYLMANFKSSTRAGTLRLIANMKSSLTSGESLATFVGTFLQLDKIMRVHEEVVQKESVLEDVTEAIIMFLSKISQSILGRDNDQIVGNIVRAIMDSVDVKNKFYHRIFPPTTQLKELFEAQNPQWDFKSGFQLSRSGKYIDKVAKDDEWAPYVYDVTLTFPIYDRNGRANGYEKVVFTEEGTARAVKTNAAVQFLEFLNHRGITVAHPASNIIIRIPQ